NATLVENLPTPCLGSLTCDQLNEAGQPTNSDPTTMTSVSCTGATTCTCQISVSATNLTQTGTHATNGTTLTLTAMGGTPNSNNYCVRGNTLYLTSVATTMSMGGTTAMGDMPLGAQLVLERQ